MAKYRIKEPIVEARQHLNSFNLKVISEQKGQQVAHKGDWLVGDERGKIYVLTQAKFDALFAEDN